MGVGGYVFPVFLKPVVDDLGWSRTEYAASHPIMSTMVALVGPLVGWAAVRIGPRPVLLFGAVCMGAALVGAGAMQVPWHFYAVAVGVGVAVACLGDLPTGAAIAARFRNQRGLMLALVYIGSNIGGTLIPLVSTWLAAGASWRHALRIIGASLWIALLPLALLVGGKPRPRAAEAEDVAPVAVARAMRERDFWLLFGVLFAFYFYRLGMNVHLVAYLSDLGYSNAGAAGGFSFTLALGIAGKLIAGAVADRIGAKIAVVGNFAIIALASALLLVPPWPGVLPTFLALHGFATAAEDVVIPLIIGQRFGLASLARLYGILLLAMIPGGTVGPILAGYLFDTSGSYTTVFALFFAGNVLAVAALAAVRTSLRSPSFPRRG